MNLKHKLVNLTNHDITLVKKVEGKDKKVTIKPSKMWARMNPLSSNKVDSVVIEGLEIDIFEQSDWHTNINWRSQRFGLPSPQKNTYYIVSRIVAYHNLERRDLLIPETNSNKNTRYLFRVGGKL